MTRESYDLLDENQKHVHEKFPAGHWLSDPEHVFHFILWCTFYERNLHRFAEDYLGLRLHLYQRILLYLMGRSRVICIVACRLSAKSWIVAVYGCCMCCLRPGTLFVIGSGVKGQGELIVTKKIIPELLGKNPDSPLHSEINESKIKTSQKVEVPFANGSSITAVIVNDNARGIRSTINLGEEAREINKKKWDEITAPYLMVRDVPFRHLPEYADDSRLEEESQSIYISSSVDERHWLYLESCKIAKKMMAGEDVTFIAFDYSITLRHKLKTRANLIDMKSSTDPITWAIEYENRVFREGSNAFFPYDLVKSNQTLRQVFRPRTTDDYITKTKNKYQIPKQPGEVRIISCDIAMIDRKKNDNSVTSCQRLLPEGMIRAATVWDEETPSEYRIQIPYLEAWRGTETEKQAIRIRQLYEDFAADYIVLDMRYAGISVLDALAKPLYDPDRCVEYEPLTCMNYPEIATRYGGRGRPVIYCVNASLRSNSEMAMGLKVRLHNHMIDLLIPKEDAEDDIRKVYPQYLIENDPDKILFYEQPYLETALLVNEMVNLEYEKMENTGLIKIRERSTMMKDRYSSVAMGCMFTDKLTNDQINSRETGVLPSSVGICVTALNY